MKMELKKVQVRVKLQGWIKWPGEGSDSWVGSQHCQVPLQLGLTRSWHYGPIGQQLRRKSIFGNSSYGDFL